ncbi:hypothetical protein OF83DRAFT_1248303 [Amylostereum chailletii]|nr:hypothetical protein OF83DRAFT_1248303 [Amylostereum chailletii]
MGCIDWVFKRPKFCCCLPVRICVIITSLLGLVLASFLAIILWYEVASTPTLGGGERASFIAAGVVETLLAVLCAIGFIGSVVRKQSFVTAYCVGLYIHFFLNLGVAGYFIYELVHTAREDAETACKNTITDPGAQDQCVGLLHIATGIFIGVASAILALEIYGAIVATRYVFRVREQKRLSRLPLHERPGSAGMKLVPGFVRYTEADGQEVYDSYYYPNKSHNRDATDYSAVPAADDNYDGNNYDPPVQHATTEGYYGHHPDGSHEEVLLPPVQHAEHEEGFPNPHLDSLLPVSTKHVPERYNTRQSTTTTTTTTTTTDDRSIYSTATGEAHRF